jgi:hypothetical protein
MRDETASLAATPTQIDSLSATAAEKTKAVKVPTRQKLLLLGENAARERI